MDEQLILRIATSVLLSFCFIALGLIIWLKRRPIVIPSKSFILVFMLFLLPAYFSHVPRVLGLSPVGMGLGLFMLTAPLLLLKIASGDFLFFNVSESLLDKSIEDVLTKHNISFVEGETKGLLAPGGETKNRKILTLNLTGLQASVRYLLSKQVMFGHIKFINKRNIPNYDELLEDLKGSLRSNEVNPASSPAYLIGAGIFVLALQVIRYLK